MIEIIDLFFSNKKVFVRFCSTISSSTVRFDIRTVDIEEIADGFLFLEIMNSYVPLKRDIPDSSLECRFDPSTIVIEQFDYIDHERNKG